MFKQKTSDSDIYAVILAGGIGSRFWPISTINTPKQILNITGKSTPLQNTVKRINQLINSDNIYIITNEALKKGVAQQVKNLSIPKRNILVEPYRKNTALPIAWIAYELYKKDPESLIIILPSDHFIKDKAKFYTTLRKAIKLARLDYLVTLGIKPNFPETAYGYIQIKPKIKNQIAKIKYFKVKRFCEKPNLEKAKRFIKNKNYYWNSGIFIWKAKTILEETKRFLPKVYFGLLKSKSQMTLKNFWGKIKPTSIDYGILEKSKRIILVPANFDWIDIGSWDALDKVVKTGPFGNIIHAKAINLDTSNTTIWSDDRLSNKRLIATVGIKDLIIVEANDAILICHKDKAQDVRKISKLLK